jgi:hypothetical protein
MRLRRSSVVVRVFVVSLLTLAVSPVTAPFSTLDLHDLFGSTPTHGTPIVHSKPAPDEAVPNVGGRADVPVVRGAIGHLGTGALRQTRGSAPLRVPLRI